MAESPTHYTRGTIEVWDFIRDQGLNYFRGNAIKYICRAGFKSTNTEIEDLQKAILYLENELQHTLSQSKSARTIPTIPNCIWDEEWDWDADYATGFDR